MGLEHTLFGKSALRGPIDSGTMTVLGLTACGVLAIELARRCVSFLVNSSVLAAAAAIFFAEKS